MINYTPNGYNFVCYKLVFQNISHIEYRYLIYGVKGVITGHIDNTLELDTIV
jgi:hypothetical protein